MVKWVIIKTHKSFWQVIPLFIKKIYKNIDWRETIELYRFLSSYPPMQNNWIQTTCAVINILANITLKLFILCILIIPLTDYIFFKQKIQVKDMMSLPQFSLSFTIIQNFSLLSVASVIYFRYGAFFTSHCLSR